MRFVFFPVVDAVDRHASCHQYLIDVEILLGRVLLAHASGLQPMAPWLDDSVEARATQRPPLHLFHPATLEYRRWYRPDGTARPHPLSQEALALRLAAKDELSIREARARLAHRSHALPAADQAWLARRRKTPLGQRPLNRAEYVRLAASLDGVWQESSGSSRVDDANRRIAQRAAAVMASLLDQYVASPFRASALTETFNEYHLAHLRQGIKHSRQAESESGSVLAGPKAWFAAKAMRMRAEHQLGLAMSSKGPAALQLSGSPMVAIIGGRVHTFVDGRRLGSRTASAPSWTQALRS